MQENVIFFAAVVAIGLDCRASLSALLDGLDSVEYHIRPQRVAYVSQRSEARARLTKDERAVVLVEELSGLHAALGIVADGKALVVVVDVVLPVISQTRECLKGALIKVAGQVDNRVIAALAAATGHALARPVAQYLLGQADGGSLDLHDFKTSGRQQCLDEWLLPGGGDALVAERHKGRLKLVELHDVFFAEVTYHVVACNVLGNAQDSESGFLTLWDLVHCATAKARSVSGGDTGGDTGGDAGSDWDDGRV